ncbi:MAG: DUF3365 domain-containing protein [Thermodesulfobacteriota bacterium]
MSKRFLAVIMVLSAFFFVAVFSGPASADSMKAKKKRAESYAREIIDLRSRLARTFIKPGMEITPETFKQVCGAVGKRIKEIEKKEGFTITHAAVRYRNPKNAATPFEARLMSRFTHSKDFKKFWDITFEGDKTYRRLIMPVFVEKACLACHGPKDKRPKFIVEKYHDDRAYDFNVGDLRGIISIRVEE